MNEDFYTLVNYVEQVSDQSGGWLVQLLKRFGNEYFLESGDVCCDAALSLLIKNDLLKENEDLVEKINAYSFITFWQRLLFLFTGKVGDKE